VNAKKVALYARVSTNDQKADLQIDALRQLARQRGWRVHAEYVDEGYSGTRDRRPALDRLMADAHKGKFGVVAVWRFDRFARSVRHLILTLDDFREKGIDFVSVNDGLDTSTATGRMTFAIVAALAQFEAELIRERTVAGLAAARRRGVRLGRRPVRVDVDRARELRSNGKSFREIASVLGISVGKAHGTLRGSVRKSPSGKA
jgi:DNA invertase Pin-like site-specific DNA recombinase